MRVPVAIAAVAGAIALAGCGTAAEDLMAINVTGGRVPTTERIRVTNDGRASCGGPLQPIPSGMLLDAREVKRDLRPLARRGARFPGPGGERHYLFRSFDGTVQWTESARRPALGHATAFTLRLTRALCHG
jgi:hypothetical protein